MKINQIFEEALNAQKEGKLKVAEKLYKEILDVQPNNLDSNNNLGVILEHFDKIEEAEKHYKKAIEIKPDIAEIHANLGGILAKLNKFKEAEKYYKKAIKLKPNSAKAHNNLGGVLLKLNKFEEAEINYKKAIELKPDFPEAYNNLAVVLKRIFKIEESEKYYKKAIELKPNFADAYMNLGNIQKELNKFEEAETNYNKAIELNPKNINYYYHFGLLKSFNNEGKKLFQLNELYLDQTLTAEERSALCFTLGKASEELNQFEKSFKYYCEGNMFCKKLLNYNIKNDIQEFEKLKKSYQNIDKNSLKNTSYKNKSKPIFIVGMPRSGTTLVEQIISSHTKVMGAGELDFIKDFGENIALGISKVDNDILINFREKYFKKLNELSKGNLMITDKMPSNFKYIGLLYSAFPEAKIVHVKRNSAATCWGNFIKHYAIKGLSAPGKKSGLTANGFSYKMDDLITYYGLYQDLMNFWNKQFGDRIYNLNYEKLTENQEDETKKLIKYLGLEWEEKCLAPQNNTRRVHTGSTIQVRQKVYKGSSDNWKKFEVFLKGVFKNLDD